MNNRKIISVFLSAVLLFGIIPVRQAEAAAYTDIKGHWAYNQIVRVTDMGLFNGVSATKFSPDGSMTRAMFVTILARYSNYNTASYNYSTFKDVPTGTWYTAAVTWAAQNGIVSGITSTKFAPSDTITREQIAVMMVRYANFCGLALPRERDGVLFADSGSCANYALDSVYTLYRAGIIDGVTATAFVPKGPATRSQAAKLMCSFMDISAQNISSEQQVKLINHRGYNAIAPENTLIAFQLAADYGYQYIETDVQFTKDDVPVLLHDSTIDRTSNGSGSVSNMTYSQLQRYDFGSWKSSAYTGTRIPTFESYIQLCAQDNISPVIELKSQMSAAQVQQLIDIVEAYGMQNKATWISFYLENLQHVRNYRYDASMAFLVSKANDTAIQNTLSLRTGYNDVSISVNYGTLTETQKTAILRNGLELVVWTVDTRSAAIEYVNSSATFITTDNITVGDLYS